MKRRVVIEDVRPTCGKISYASRGEASVALRSHSRGMHGLGVYQCRRCGLFHLGRKHKSQASPSPREGLS